MSSDSKKTCPVCGVAFSNKDLPYRLSQRAWAARTYCARSCASVINGSKSWPEGATRVAEIMEEWDFLRRDGATRAQAAERMGMTWVAFDRAWHRAKSAGDPRAIDPGHTGPYGDSRIGLNMRGNKQW